MHSVDLRCVRDIRSVDLRRIQDLLDLSTLSAFGIHSVDLRCVRDTLSQLKVRSGCALTSLAAFGMVSVDLRRIQHLPASVLIFHT